MQLTWAGKQHAGLNGSVVLATRPASREDGCLAASLIPTLYHCTVCPWPSGWEASAKRPPGPLGNHVDKPTDHSPGLWTGSAVLVSCGRILKPSYFGISDPLDSGQQVCISPTPCSHLGGTSLSRGGQTGTEGKLLAGPWTCVGVPHGTHIPGHTYKADSPITLIDMAHACCFRGTPQPGPQDGVCKPNISLTLMLGGYCGVCEPGCFDLKPSLCH